MLIQTITLVMFICLAAFLGFLWAGFTSCKENVLDNQIFKDRWITSTLCLSLLILILVKLFLTF